MDLGTTPLTAITVICGLAAMGFKATKLDPKHIPFFCGVFGCILGILAAFYMPGFPADNLFSAAEIGILSGLAATGVHQAFKQGVSRG